MRNKFLDAPRDDGEDVVEDVEIVDVRELEPARVVEPADLF
ncbi:MAG: hypothetical protein Q8Q36_00250 [bacterium]|nr:hypothetical protein [bacterium]